MDHPKILHVEDDDAYAFLLQAALERAALWNRIFRVSSGENALAFLLKAGWYKDAESPDLVILDLGLPGVDGWAVLSMMRRHRELSGIPVVVLSSSEAEADRVRALGLGARGYVVKQPTIAGLREALLGAVTGDGVPGGCICPIGRCEGPQVQNC